MMRLSSPVQPDLDGIFTEQDELEATKRESRLLGLYQSSRAELLADAEYRFSDLLSVEQDDLAVMSQKKLFDVEFEKAKQTEQDRTTSADTGITPLPSRAAALV